MRSAKTLIVGAVALGACVSSTPQPPPVLPTPFPEIATTPELQAWTTAQILKFRQEQETEGFIGLGLETLSMSAALESVDSRDIAVLISASEPPAGWFATPISTEPVVIVVNPQNPIDNLAVDDVIAIFAGRVDNWQSLGGPEMAIIPIVPLDDAETRSYLQRHLLRDLRFTSSALLGPSPEAVLALVEENVGAVGIVPLSTVSEDVRPVSIDGSNPEQFEAYPWLLEVLAMSPEEPSGIVRDWLAWLQSTRE